MEVAAIAIALGLAGLGVIVWQARSGARAKAESSQAVAGLDDARAVDAITGEPLPSDADAIADLLRDR